MSDLENDATRDDGQRALEAELQGLRPKFDGPYVGGGVEAELRRHKKWRARLVIEIVLAAAACVAIVLFEVHLREPITRNYIGPAPTDVVGFALVPVDDSSFSLASLQSAAAVSPDALNSLLSQQGQMQGPGLVGPTITAGGATVQ